MDKKELEQVKKRALEYKKKMLSEDKDIAALKKIIMDLNDLGFDYDRMSSSGQETYDRIQTQMKKLAPTLGEALHFYNDA